MGSGNALGIFKGVLAAAAYVIAFAAVLAAIVLFKMSFYW
jgi:hypothetical protein